MSRNRQDDQTEGDFQSLGSIFNDMQGRLFGFDNEPPTLESVVKKAPKPKDNTQLVAAAQQIAARPPDKGLGEIVYTMRELVQCNFPIRDPGEVPAWTRKNGNLTLIIKPGIDAETGLSLGIPRGEWPRLYMGFFQRQVMMHRRRGIYMGRTTNEVLRAAGNNDTSRGKNSSAKQALTELERLLAAEITIVRKTTHQEIEMANRKRLNVPITDFTDTWWSTRQPDQLSLFKSEIILGERLFQMMLNDPIPVDLRVLLALKQSLKQSSFAMDIYNWQQSHLYKMRENSQLDIKIQWKYLPDQFGAEFSRLRDWKASFEENFLHVEQLAPALKHEFEGDYLILRDMGGRSGVMPATRRKMERLVNQISPKSRDWFYSNFPIHANDLAEIEAAFNSWREKEGIASRNPDKHFESFVRYNWFKQPKPKRGV